MTFPVDPLHAPVDLAAGDRVDVWATVTDGGSTSVIPPVLVLPRVLVVSADRESLGVGGEIAVVVEVPKSQVSAAVSAIRSGVVDLAAVPITEAMIDSPDAGVAGIAGPATATRVEVSP